MSPIIRHICKKSKIIYFIDVYINSHQPIEAAAFSWRIFLIGVASLPQAFLLASVVGSRDPLSAFSPVRTFFSVLFPKLPLQFSPVPALFLWHQEHVSL